MPTGGASGRERLDEYLRNFAAGEGDILLLKAGAPPRVRALGHLTDLGPERLDKASVSEIASSLMEPAIAQRLVERRRAEFAYGIDGIARFRVSAFSQRGSLALQFCKVPLDPPVLEDLALPACVQRLANQTSGLVIVAGPPGSGRTTTLHAMVDYLNRTSDTFLVTVEQPVEILHRDLVGTVVQLEVGGDVPDTASGILAAVRQSGDVVMVGDVDDSEVADRCLAAAEAGLLVLAGFEARTGTDPTEAFIGLSPSETRDRARLRLAGALAGVTLQQLVRRRDGAGRVAAVEVQMTTPAAREAVLEGEPFGWRDDDAGSGSAQTIEHSLAALCAAGTIDLRTAMMAAPSWDLLNDELAAHGVETTAAS